MPKRVSRTVCSSASKPARSPPENSRGEVVNSRRVLKRNRLARRQAPRLAAAAFQIRTTAVCIKALTGEGLGHDAETGAAVDIMADQRSPDRNAGDEGAGSVDRIDHPLPSLSVATAHDGAELLAQNGMVGKPLADQRTDRLFRRPIGLCHRIEIARSELVVDAATGPETRQRLAIRGVGQFQQECRVRLDHALESLAALTAGATACRAYFHENLILRQLQIGQEC